MPFISLAATNCAFVLIDKANGGTQAEIKTLEKNIYLKKNK